MEETAENSPSGRWRLPAALGILIALAFASWQSIPRERMIFSPDLLAVSRAYQIRAGGAIRPSGTSGRITSEAASVRVHPGASLRFDVADFSGLLRGCFQYVDGSRGGIIEIAAWNRDGTKETILRRVLLPAAQTSTDGARMHFLADPAACAPGTTSVVLSVPADSPGAVDWSEISAQPRNEALLLSKLPFPLLAFEGLAEPAVDGAATILGHAPMEFVFRVAPGPGQLSGTFGLNPELFKRSDADSDGIDVTVSLESDSGRQILFQRQFDPRNRPEDRKLVTETVSFAPRHPARLLLSVGPGPHGSFNWDWTVLQDLQAVPSVAR